MSLTAEVDATIRSVLDQTYERWELCLADGNSPDPRVRESLRVWAASDPRIGTITPFSNIAFTR